MAETKANMRKREAREAQALLDALSEDERAALDGQEPDTILALAELGTEDAAALSDLSEEETAALANLSAEDVAALSADDDETPPGADESAADESEAQAPQTVLSRAEAAQALGAVEAAYFAGRATKTELRDARAALAASRRS